MVVEKEVVKTVEVPVEVVKEVVKEVQVRARQSSLRKRSSRPSKSPWKWWSRGKS